MGKKKEKRFRAVKNQPTGLLEIRDDNLAECLDARSPALVADVLSQLQSPEEETRECGCATLAALVAQPGAIRILMKANVVRILAPLVLDPSPSVKHRALGALRNMTVDGGEEVCQEMVMKDVITPLIALLKQFEPGWQPENIKLKHMDTKLSIFTEAIHVLWNLCEASDTAVRAFNREQLLPVVLPCLQHSVYGFSLATAVAQCLYSITDDNKESIAFCRRDEILSSLQSLAQRTGDTSSSGLFQAAILGILTNVMGEDIMTGPGLVSMVTAMAEILNSDVSSLISATLKMTQENEIPETSEGRKDNVEETTTLSKNQMEISNAIDAQKLCLVLVTNMCCSQDEDWEDMDSSDSRSSDELVNDVDMEDVAGSSSAPMCTATEVHAVLASSNIIGKVVQLSCPLPDELLHQIKAFSWGRQILKRLTRLRIHALLCLNNLIDSMATEALGGMEVLHGLWDALAQQVIAADRDVHAPEGTESLSQQDADLLEAVASAMRAVIQKLGQLGSPKFSTITAGDLHFLVKMVEGASSRTQVHIVRTVATIAGMLAKIDPQHTVVQEVGGFLMSVAGQSADVVVVAEALDSLFDLFADDATDPIAQQLRLTERLQAILPLLKAKLQGQRRSLGEDFVTVSAAKTNLIRFIKYKELMSKS